MQSYMVICAVLCGCLMTKYLHWY